MLKNGANPNLIITNSPSILMLAAACSDPNVVDLLLHYGADVKKVDGMGHSVIWYAVEGNPENIYLLAKAGADINHVDKNGETPLQSAINSFKLQEPRYAAISTLVMLKAVIPTNETNELIRTMLQKKFNELGARARPLSHQPWADFRSAFSATKQLKHFSALRISPDCHLLSALAFYSPLTQFAASSLATNHNQNKLCHLNSPPCPTTKPRSNLTLTR